MDFADLSQMRPVARKLGAAATAAVGIVLSGAASPSFFAQMNRPGLWEIERNGFEPRRLCLASSKELAQLEHANARCSRTVIHDSRSEAVVHYACRGSDFGQSRLTMMTPRSIRVETQGISGSSPFHYTFQARRVGDCPTH